ncbi:MAG: polysaccharide biosynthesis/export family protein [Rhodospirillales bacterium]
MKASSRKVRTADSTDRLSRLVALFAGCVIIAFTSTGCTTTTPQQSSDRFLAWSDAQPAYRLQTGDQLSIVHPYSPELNQDVTILPDGRIVLPLIGAAPAADMIPEKLAQDLEIKYLSELKEPDVTVIPRTIGPMKFVVGGEVGNPGVFTYTGRIGVVEALFTAGGFVDTANRSTVALIRRSEDDQPMLKVINVAAILSGNGTESDIPLQQYDVIYVPKSTVAEVGTWVDLYINRILPFNRGFSYSLTKTLE